MTTSTEVASEGFITPDWPAPANVRTLITTRRGGVSRGVYASLNLGDHVSDDPLAVAKNRVLVSHRIGARPLWLKQVHGTHVVEAGDCLEADPNGVPEADASFTHRTGVACAVMTADCLPVLFCNPAGTVVAAAHAGWRGLLDGVLEATMGTLGAPGDELIAYLGPAIGPQAFEVGDEVRAAFVARSMGAPVGEIRLACNGNDTLPRYFAGDDYAAQPTRATLANAVGGTSKGGRRKVRPSRSLRPQSPRSRNFR